MNRPKTTIEAAHDLGISRKTLIVYLVRHPELRPAQRLPSGHHLWSEEEIERLRQARTRPVAQATPA